MPYDWLCVTQAQTVNKGVSTLFVVASEAHGVGFLLSCVNVVNQCFQSSALTVFHEGV